MEPKKDKIAAHKSRRGFLKKTGAIITGLSLTRPFSYLSGRSYLELKRKDNSLLKPLEYLQDDDILPEGVNIVWDISKAYHETTASRERICINGLWRWQPVRDNKKEIPVNDWGYFKVPGNWPGISNYLQKESQIVYAHESWKKESLGNIDAAWYQREITIPEHWSGHQIILSSEYLNSSARVFINESYAGEILFPGGELDLTSLCIAGEQYMLSLEVTALPLNDVVAIYSDSNASRQGKGQVTRRGLCGDIFLQSFPKNERINDIAITTSFRKSEISFRVALENLLEVLKYKLHFEVKYKGNKVNEFTSTSFNKDELMNGYFTFTASWLTDKLWDIHTPGNIYECTITLHTKDNILLDTAFNQQFGFREFWIEGRDFYLNGKHIYLSAVPLDNALIGAALANYEAAKESMLRLMSFGINFVYTHNYGCEPGTHLSYNEILKAADDTGMLISLSQPHFGQYDWPPDDKADQISVYAHHARFYTKVAGNHPSVVFYSMSHNACGYSDDMNPDMIDGLSRTDSEWSARNVKKALRAEAIVAKIDPGRIIYHHSSGNLSSMHTSNFYPNWVPVQELSDWFEHWATEGVKPLFLCEFGAPFMWDWGLYRGWYKGKREFGSAAVPWEFCLAEWNSQFIGDDAFNISELEKINLRWEAKRFNDGKTWYRWDYPHSFGDSAFNERIPILMEHLTDQWRAFRTWGMSSNSPWDFASYWQLHSDFENVNKNLNVDWEYLQKPGFSADFTERGSRMDLDVAFDRSDWTPTAATALMKNNMPLLAYIGGKQSAFTSKDHNCLPGTMIEKQLIIINNSRMDVLCECKWLFNLPLSIRGNKTIRLSPGEQVRIPLEFEIPSKVDPGTYNILATVDFGTSEIQSDTFEINVLADNATIKQVGRTALFDPKGETQKLLDDIGIQYNLIDVIASLEEYDLLIIGKEAMTVGGSGLNIEGVRTGLKVIMFEQRTEVLEKRFGFRVSEYGLRKVFCRIPDHPALDGLTQENLQDWKGASTLTDPRLNYTTNDNEFNGAPTIRWCNIPVTQVWRCGNRGNVASVLIEKPACGDFLPIVDGGYSLQYSPLLEFREGDGMVLFCQIDVCGRTESDPAAEKLVKNILAYVSNWKTKIKRETLYAGDPLAYRHLQSTGMKIAQYEKQKLKENQLLITSPDSGKQLLSHAKEIKNWIKAGGHLLAIGFEQEDADEILPFSVGIKKKEHIATYFNSYTLESPFAGVGPSDVHNRDPKDFPLFSEGVEKVGNGILAKTENANVVFCQLKPWENEYGNGKHNVKQTYRRSSFLLNRLIANLGAQCSTPLLERFNTPANEDGKDKRWLKGFYLDQPEEWDYPYRFFRW